MCVGFHATAPLPLNAALKTANETNLSSKLYGQLQKLYVVVVVLLYLLLLCGIAFFVRFYVLRQAIREMEN